MECRTIHNIQLTKTHIKEQQKKLEKIDRPRRENEPKTIEDLKLTTKLPVGE